MVYLSAGVGVRRGIGVYRRTDRDWSVTPRISVEITTTVDPPNL